MYNFLNLNVVRLHILTHSILCLGLRMVNQGTLDTTRSSSHPNNYHVPRIKGRGTEMCSVLVGRAEGIILPGFSQAEKKEEKKKKKG